MTPRPVPDHAWRDAVAKAKPREVLMLRLAAEAGLRCDELAKRPGSDGHLSPPHEAYRAAATCGEGWSVVAGIPRSLVVRI
jgi:hypothetical protein